MISSRPLVFGCALTLLLVCCQTNRPVFAQAAVQPEFQAAPSQPDTELAPLLGELHLERLPPVTAELGPMDQEDQVPAHSFWHVPTYDDCCRFFKRDEDPQSWRARKFSTGYSLGVMDGDHLVRGRLDQGTGLTFSKRWGWDFADYWGAESRFLEASLPIIDITGHMQTHTGHMLLNDTSLLLYPWGDTRLRPFLSFGVGLAYFNFDDIGGRQNKFVVDLPAGFGCKYYWNESLTIRADITDNLVLAGQGLSTTNNASFTFGVEVRFGSLRGLWPWHKCDKP